MACLRTRLPLLVPDGGSAPPRNDDGEWAGRGEEEKVGTVSGEMSAELNWTVDVVIMRAARHDFSGSQVGSLKMAWRPATSLQPGFLQKLDCLQRPIQSLHLISTTVRTAELYDSLQKLN